MRRSISTLLGVTAAAGIVALGVPALASPAAASTASPDPRAALTDSVDRWGPIFARNGLASARGVVRDNWFGVRRNTVTVSGQLTDRDFRTFRRGGKCAYVNFDLRRLGAPRFAFSDGPTYTWCGADKAPRSFSFTRNNIGAVRATVCQIDRFGGRPLACRTQVIYDVRR